MLVHGGRGRGRVGVCVWVRACVKTKQKDAAESDVGNFPFPFLLPLHLIAFHRPNLSGWYLSLEPLRGHIVVVEPSHVHLFGQSTPPHPKKQHVSTNIYRWVLVCTFQFNLITCRWILVCTFQFNFQQ